MASIVTVFLPTGSRAEANEARAALERTGWKLCMSTAFNHSAGQAIPGDAILVGRGPVALDADVQGRLWKVDSLEHLKTFDFQAKLPKPEAPKPEPVTAPAAAEPESAEIVGRRDLQQALIGGDDDLEALNRVQLVQLAARKWPGMERWTTMSNDVLRAKIRELDNH